MYSHLIQYPLHTGSRLKSIEKSMLTTFTYFLWNAALFSIFFFAKLAPCRLVKRPTYWVNRGPMPALLEQYALALGRTMQKTSAGAEARGKRGTFWSKRSQGSSTGARQKWHLANPYQVIPLRKGDWSKPLKLYLGVCCEERGGSNGYHNNTVISGD